MLNGKSKQLKPRQAQILKLICSQYTNKEIANALGLSIRTIDAHRDVLLKKTQSKNTVGLVIYALSNQIFKLEELKTG